MKHETGTHHAPHAVHTKMSFVSIVLEMCICGLMAAAIAIWYTNATKVVQDNGFVTR